MIDKSYVPIDRAMSEFLASRSGLEGAEKRVFRTVVENLIGALREGHICIEPDESERAVLLGSRMVDNEGRKPLVLSGARLYLARYYHHEAKLAESLNVLASMSFDVAGSSKDLISLLSDTEKTPEMMKAVDLALSGGLSIIAGGPGTGKTTLVVKIVGMLLTVCGIDLHIALAAPTGKAAIRLQESISALLPHQSFSPDVVEAFPQKASTLHRLLRVKRSSSAFVHHADNPMPWDVVVVDEASMVDLALMHRLVAALKQHSRLILIGDKDQLASVESGAVLADCIDVLGDNVVQLRESHRFNHEIARVSAAIKRGDPDGVWKGLTDHHTKSTCLADSSWLKQVAGAYAGYLSEALKVRDEQGIRRLFALFSRYRVLCALKHGVSGVDTVNRQVEASLRQQGFPCGTDQWYPGRPVMVTCNDYRLGLYNGDIGICLKVPGQSGERAVWFEQGGTALRPLLPNRLPDVETAWAVTIHKSQGSEFDEVVIVLPDTDNPVLCRELLYTAVTRARKRAVVVARQDICRLAVLRKTRRSSGLADRLLGGNASDRF